MWRGISKGGFDVSFQFSSPELFPTGYSAQRRQTQLILFEWWPSLRGGHCSGGGLRWRGPMSWWCGCILTPNRAQLTHWWWLSGPALVSHVISSGPRPSIAASDLFAEHGIATSDRWHQDQVSSSCDFSEVWGEKVFGRGRGWEGIIGCLFAILSLM